MARPLPLLTAKRESTFYLVIDLEVNRSGYMHDEVWDTDF